MPLLREEGWLRHQALEQAQTGWSLRAMLIEVVQDLLQHALNISEDPFVLDPDHANIPFFKVSCPPRVVLQRLFRKMRRPIQLDNNALFRTKEIDNVRTYATLPAEFVAIEAAVFEQSPEDTFWCCWRITQFFTTASGS